MHIVIVLLVLILVFSILTQARYYLESFDLPSCAIPSQLVCGVNHNWQCIDNIPARVKADGTIEFLDSSTWNPAQANVATNCSAFTSTMNMIGVGDANSAKMNAIYDSHVTKCGQECGDQSSSCYHAYVNMPALNGCDPVVTGTI